MARGDHGLPKVSPGPPMPNLSTPCSAGGPPLKQPFSHLRGGRPTGRAACGLLLPPKTPHAIRLCACAFRTDLLSVGFQELNSFFERFEHFIGGRLPFFDGHQVTHDGDESQLVTFLNGFQPVISLGTEIKSITIGVRHGVSKGVEDSHRQPTLRATPETTIRLF
jgi:hypothetical protein